MIFSEIDGLSEVTYQQVLNKHHWTDKDNSLSCQSEDCFSFLKLGKHSYTANVLFVKWEEVVSTFTGMESHFWAWRSTVNRFSWTFKYFGQFLPKIVVGRNLRGPETRGPLDDAIHISPINIYFVIFDSKLWQFCTLQMLVAKLQTN